MSWLRSATFWHEARLGAAAASPETGSGRITPALPVCSRRFHANQCENSRHGFSILIYTLILLKMAWNSVAYESERKDLEFACNSTLRRLTFTFNISAFRHPRRAAPPPPSRSRPQAIGSKVTPIFELGGLHGKFFIPRLINWNKTFC